jgi:hypothetical protein
MRIKGRRQSPGRNRLDVRQGAGAPDDFLDRTYAEHLSRGGSQVAGYPAPTARVNEPGRNLWASLKLFW